MRRSSKLGAHTSTAAGVTLVALTVSLAGATTGEFHSGPRAKFANSVADRVDAEIARYFLEEYRAGQRSNPRWDRPLARWTSLSPTELLEPGVLKSIAEESGSVDLAASIFAATMAESPLQSRLDDRILEDRAAETTLGSRYTIVLVPGWLYQSHGEATGADFAASRVLLSQLRIDHVLVATLENGSIEENARIVSKNLRDLAGQGRELIVVSTSKGGPEVALALASMGESASAVAAWLNIGGLLRGTALADKALEPSRKWFVGTVLWWKGWKRSGLVSLTTRAASSRRLEDLVLPSHLLVVSLIAAPLSGDVSKRARDGYRKLRAVGPNDGLTLLTDAIWPGGETLVIPGTDHFFWGIEVDHLTVSVLRTIEQAIDDRAASARERQPTAQTSLREPGLASIF